MNSPTCQVCGAEGNGVQFSLFPGVAGYRFGEICVNCEQEAKAN